MPSPRTPPNSNPRKDQLRAELARLHTYDTYDLPMTRTTTGATAAPAGVRRWTAPAEPAEHRCETRLPCRDGQNTGTVTSWPASTAPAVVSVSGLTAKCWVTTWTS